MESLQKKMLEIETSGDENSNKIIKLVAAFKALIKKTNDNEVNSFNNVYYNYINTFWNIFFKHLKKQTLKLEIISDSLKHHLKSIENCFSRSIEMIEEMMERLASQLQNIENQTSENKRIDNVNNLKIKIIFRIKFIFLIFEGWNARNRKAL